MGDLTRKNCLKYHSLLQAIFTTMLLLCFFDDAQSAIESRPAIFNPNNWPTMKSVYGISFGVNMCATADGTVLLDGNSFAYQHVNIGTPPDAFFVNTGRNFCWVSGYPVGYVYGAQLYLSCPKAEPPYTLKPTSGTCERDIPCLPPNILVNGQCEPPESFSITINQTSADLQPALAATIDPVTGKDSTFKKFVATVTGDKHGVKANTPVTIKADVVQGTGGHVHTDTLKRPKGYLNSDQTNSSCDGVQPAACIKGSTDPNGQFVFTFHASEVSGEHTVTATCDLCNGGKADLAIKVAVPGLAEIPVSPFYELQEADPNSRPPGQLKNIGGTDTHKKNHYATAAARTGLRALAIKYNETINPGQKLYINDASLEWGGLLDDDANWLPPHKTHRRGDAIDIRADSNNQKTGEIPPKLFDRVRKEANGLSGVTPEIHCYPPTGKIIIARAANPAACEKLNSGRHFHITFR